MPDLYSILGLSNRAKNEEVKAAYRTLARLYHPDLNAGDMEAERRTKEINRAYETLGNPEMRAAYDLKLASQRARARRVFWSAAATGAATYMLIAGSVLVTVMWRQHAETRQVPSGEPGLLTRNARNESTIAKPPAEGRTTPSSALPADSNNVPSESVSAPPPGAFEKPPTSANSEIASTSIRDGEVQTRGEPAAQSSLTLERPSTKDVARAVSSERVSEVQSPEGQPVPPAPVQDAPPRTGLANAASPTAGEKEQMPAFMAEQRSGEELTRRDAERMTAAVGRIHKKRRKQFNIAEVSRTPTPSKPQGVERKPSLILSSSTALRWPSADEPFVNVGARSR